MEFPVLPPEINSVLMYSGAGSSPLLAAAAAVTGDDDSLDEHAHDTVSGGDWLCDQDAVEA
ncbi:PPE domain-containing protein, partial [Mycobacterium tuberculosis]|nr:PPE domain-containing protein [Mycobacterium tuberculosis]